MKQVLRDGYLSIDFWPKCMVGLHNYIVQCMIEACVRLYVIYTTVCAIYHFALMSM